METKTKANYTKINRDECTVADLRDWLVGCKLYYKTTRGFELIVTYTISGAYDVFVGDTDIYKIDTDCNSVDSSYLEEEIEAIKCNDLLFLARPHCEEILIHHGDCLIDINFDTFHKISETLKRHGK